MDERERLFVEYGALGNRIEDLKAPFQNEMLYTTEELAAWVEQVKARMREFIALNERAAAYLRKHKVSILSPEE